MPYQLPYHQSAAWPLRDASLHADYRNFGGSGGQPREVLSVPRQRADYSTVIGWAVEQPYIDPRQIIVWGTSFAGMHVLELAVSDNRLAAAVAQAHLPTAWPQR